MKVSNIPLAQLVVQQCKAHGIKHIVISPGSRSAPLTISFTQDIFFKCFSIVDERCAAFFALGIAQQTNHPVALVCTSGSALLNYYPAVSEAFYSRIPIIVLSADRPKYKVDIGDGQTIKQPNVYGKHSLYNSNLRQDVFDDEPLKQNDIPLLKILKSKGSKLSDLKKNVEEFNTAEINKALQISIQQSGPVHLNIPFEEPLYDTTEIESSSITVVLDSDQHSDFKISTKHQDIWHMSCQNMIPAGGCSPPT